MKTITTASAVSQWIVVHYPPNPPGFRRVKARIVKRGQLKPSKADLSQEYEL